MQSDFMVEPFIEQTQTTFDETGLTDWVTDCEDSAVISEGCNKETIVSGK